MNGRDNVAEADRSMILRACDRLIYMVKHIAAADDHRAATTRELAAEGPNTLAAERTLLAVDRTYLAGERNLMAWIRTALSMISFGFTLGKIGQAMQDPHVEGLLGRRTFSILNISYLLVIMGTVSLAAAIVQYWIRVRELYTFGLAKQFSVTSIVAAFLVVMGIFAFSALVLRV
jgi:putative membrane protein